MAVTRKQAAAAAKMERQPTATPPFTVATLRKAIPAHCFKRSALTSSVYLLVDLTLAALLYLASTRIDSAPVPAWAKWALLWPAYWFFQGAVCTGLWVIGHECGHQAYSESQAINDGVGLVIHSLLLVPYYSWKHSHRRHHSNTNNLDKDEVFVPKQRAEASEGFEWEQLGLVRLVKIIISTTLGWHMYLLANVSSHKYERFANHFDPWSPIFSKRERVEVAVSDAALAAVVYGLVALGRSFGWAWLVKSYVIPYMVVNFWLVTITLLQHSHPSLPHYTDKEWNWLQGALATVDRDYGFMNYFHHHIQDTHVAHHLFSTIPHYHAQEATEAIKPILGKYYKSDSRPVLRSLWEDFTATRYVAPDEPDSGVMWFRK